MRWQDEVGSELKKMVKGWKEQWRLVVQEAKACPGL
jgi:hypothetical protein